MLNLKCGCPISAMKYWKYSAWDFLHRNISGPLVCRMLDLYMKFSCGHWLPMSLNTARGIRSSQHSLQRYQKFSVSAQNEVSDKRDEFRKNLHGRCS